MVNGLAYIVHPTSDIVHQRSYIQHLASPSSFRSTKKPDQFPDQAFFIIEVYGLIVYHFYNFGVGFTSIFIDLRNTDIGIFAINRLVTFFLATDSPNKKTG